MGKIIHKVRTKIADFFTWLGKKIRPKAKVKKTWRDKAMEAIEEEEEPDMTDEEIREKYDEEQ